MNEHYFEQNKSYYRTNEFLPDRPTLVFVHGVSGSSSAWLAYEEFFGKAYNVLSFDLRGHGKSGKYAAYEDYAVGNFVQDIHDLLKHLAIEKCTMVSHSMGTLIALDYLLEHQDMIASAVFISPNFSISQKAVAAIIKPLSRIAGAIDIVIRSPEEGGHTDYSKYPRSGDWNIPRMIDDIRNTSMRVYLHCTRQVCEFQRLDLLDRITVPVLIIHGKKDTIFPVKNSVMIAKKIKGAQLLLIDNASHSAQQVVMDEAAQAIDEFLAQSVYTH